VGFNPFRPQSKSILDVVMVAVALLATVGVILWALFGG
jgi:hypothetical protein